MARWRIGLPPQGRPKREHYGRPPGLCVVWPLLTGGLRPRLMAMVPAMSFVDELVEESGCGVAVNARDVASIRAGLDELRSPTARARMIARGRALSEQLQSDDWMRTLLQRLVVGVRPGEVPHRFHYRSPEPVPSPEPARSPDRGQTREEDSAPTPPSSDPRTADQDEPDLRVVVEV